MASCRGAAGQKEAHVPRDLRKRVQKYHRDAVAEGAGAPQRRVPGRRSGGCRAAAAEGARRCGGGGRQRPWWRSVAAVVVVGGGRGGGRRRPWWWSVAAVVAVGGDGQRRVGSACPTGRPEGRTSTPATSDGLTTTLDGCGGRGKSKSGCENARGVPNH